MASTPIQIEKLSPLFENALDSLRIGMDFFQREPDYSTRKHAILTIFHSIELLLKERLFRANRVLIYRNLDKRIAEDSQTVGLDEAIIRLENIGVNFDAEMRGGVKKIQARRNRIEHHRFDHDAKNDELIIGEALKFIFDFVEFVLDARLEDHLDPTIIASMRQRIFRYNDLEGRARARFETWIKSVWPDWDEQVEDTPEEFEGTHDCPNCRQSWLVMDHHEVPFCFWCNASVAADDCEHCGRTFLIENGCWCGGEFEREPGAFG